MKIRKNDEDSALVVLSDLTIYMMALVDCQYLILTAVPYAMTSAALCMMAEVA